MQRNKSSFKDKTKENIKKNAIKYIKWDQELKYQKLKTLGLRIKIVIDLVLKQNKKI